MVVIGGGQAGLAMSAVLRERGRESVILERGQVGGRWRTERWESLCFQFPNWSVGLPGYAYAGPEPDGFAHWREILSLLEGYAHRTRAAVCEHTEVSELAVDDDGFRLSLPGATIRARNVVVATGPYQRPQIPHFAHAISSSVVQTDATRYRRPEALPDGAVLVVGSGASGCQIADDLRRAGRGVFLSVSAHRRLPRRLSGKDVYWWLDRMGEYAQTVDGVSWNRPRPGIVVTGVSGGYDVDVREMAAAGVRVVGRILGARDDRVVVAQDANETLDQADATFAAFVARAREWAAAHPDHELSGDEPASPRPTPGLVAEVDALDLHAENISAIVWATGYAFDYDWIPASVLDGGGRPLQRRGVSPVPGLYFLGLRWMHTAKSSLLSGVGADADYLASYMDMTDRARHRA